MDQGQLGMNDCCSECGKEEGGAGVRLKVCKSCMHAKYCNASCQKNHWASHKKDCKQRAAELHDEALFKDPPAKEDCPICFLPIPKKMICCISLPPATTSSVPIYDFAIAHKEIANENRETYFTCCGKSICEGCLYSCHKSEIDNRCPFCNVDRGSSKTEMVMKRVEANDPASIFILGDHYYKGVAGIQQDRTKAKDLWNRAAELGHSNAHYYLAEVYFDEGDMKKAMFHCEAAAMAGHENARYNLGCVEYDYGNIERALKHWTIVASAGDYHAMNRLRTFFEKGHVSRESIYSTLTAYNYSCVEMRSEARDASIYAAMTETI